MAHGLPILLHYAFSAKTHQCGAQAAELALLHCDNGGNPTCHTQLRPFDYLAIAHASIQSLHQNDLNSGDVVIPPAMDRRIRRTTLNR